MGNYYDTVKEKIADYITREPVEETEEVISAYTLFSIIKNCKKRLRHVEEVEKGLVDKLNSIYPQTIIKEKKGLFNKKTKFNRFDGVCHWVEDNNTKLHLTSENNSSITLAKDYMYPDIYSTNKGLTEDAYNECIDDISYVLGELDYFGSLFNNDNSRDKSELSNKISGDGFDLEVQFDNSYGNPKFNYGIKLNKKIDPNGHADAYFYGKDNNIQGAIEENMEAILRNTPVNMSDLSYMFCMLVVDYRNREDKKKIDEEIDQAFQKLYEKNKTN